MAIPRDCSAFLWLLKLGAPANLYFLAAIGAFGADERAVLLAQAFFTVSAYRCLFPVRYEGNVVFHDSPLSSIFLTRLLATASEVAYVALFAWLLHLLNAGRAAWVDAASWVMATQVIVSQVFVWRAILAGDARMYFYEELGWGVIFAVNTAASAYLWRGAPTCGAALLLELSLVFGAVYLPWQIIHLRTLWARSRNEPADADARQAQGLAAGVKRALRERNRRADADSWGGWIGLSWMTGYWATLIPAWVYCVVRVLPEVP